MKSVIHTQIKRNFQKILKNIHMYCAYFPPGDFDMIKIYITKHPDVF